VSDVEREPEHTDEHEVTPLELFFDLTFVFAMTQVTILLADDPSWGGVLRGMLVLAALWWAWTAYAWLTSAVDVDEGGIRLVMLASMGAMFGVALAVPGAFGEDAVLFGIAYLFVRLLHLVLSAVVGRDDPDRRVRYQLSRGTAAKPSRLVRLKTHSAAREVVLSEPLAATLREHRERALATGRHGADEFLFSTRTGKPLSHRNATRTILRASDAAGLDPVGFHVLRHGFASALIVDLGLDPVQVARQLGHTRPSLTLDTYSHLFDRVRHAENMRERLASSALATAVAHLP
jgi:hypothetical protein